MASVELVSEVGLVPPVAHEVALAALAVHALTLAALVVHALLLAALVVHALTLAALATQLGESSSSDINIATVLLATYKYIQLLQLSSFMQ